MKKTSFIIFITLLLFEVFALSHAGDPPPLTLEDIFNKANSIRYLSYQTKVTSPANTVRIFREKCISGLKVNEPACRRHVENSTATITALISKIGYEKAQNLIKQKQESQKSIRKLVLENGLFSESDFEYLISAEAVNRLGEPGEKGRR